ncbi:cation channel sperm-associated protein 1-like [Penaeus monodon]|uniref:cation channel sperm-associated protein 1-like n=1 Tax=Penaeus monodon TaxID=6687 RepID=UPI0018A6F0A6|nr:cation channel sperm-associated protein 1-like [Penaeus monodon]
MRVIVPVILAVICLEGTADVLPWHRSHEVPGHGHRSHGYSPGIRSPSPWRGHRSYSSPGEHGRLSYGSTSHGHLGSSSSSSAPVYGQRINISPPWHPGHNSQHEQVHPPVDRITSGTPAGVPQRNATGQGKLSSLLLLGGKGSDAHGAHKALGKHKSHVIDLLPDRRGYSGSPHGFDEPSYHSPYHDHHAHEPFSHHKYDSPHPYKQGPSQHDSRHPHYPWSPSSHHDHGPPFSPYQFWRFLFHIDADSHYRNLFHHNRGHQNHHGQGHHNHYNHHDHHNHGHRNHHDQGYHDYHNHGHRNPHDHNHHHHQYNVTEIRCPKNYDLVGNLCLHMLVNFSLRSWDVARQYCRNLGGDLLTFSSANEFATVASHFQNLSTDHAGFWVGGRIVNKSWTWINNNYRSFLGIGF